MPLTTTGTPSIWAVAEAPLGKVSRGHDRGGGLGPGVVREAHMERRQRRGQLVRRQLLPDHPGRADVNLVRPAAHQRGGRIGGPPHCGVALLPGRGVGVARIDHQRPSGAIALPEQRATPVHRRCRRVRTGERACHRRPRREGCKQQIGAAPVAEPRLGGSKPNPWNGRQVGEARGRKGDIAVIDLSWRRAGATIQADGE